MGSLAKFNRRSDRDSTNDNDEFDQGGDDGEDVGIVDATARIEFQKRAERTIYTCDPDDVDQPMAVDSITIAEIERRLNTDSELQLNAEDYDFIVPDKPEMLVRQRLASYYNIMKERPNAIDLDLPIKKMLDDRIETLTITETREKEYNRVKVSRKKKKNMSPLPTPRKTILG